MRFLIILIFSFILGICPPAYARGEQIIYFLSAELLLLIGWFVFLLIYRASWVHKIIIFGVVLIAITYPLFTPLGQDWHEAFVMYPVGTTLIFISAHTILGVGVFLILSRLLWKGRPPQRSH
jgi:hypothetical protein